MGLLTIAFVEDEVARFQGKKPKGMKNLARVIGYKYNKKSRY